MFNFLNISKFFLFASIFSVLVITISTLFPFIVGKMIFFRVCVELALAFYLLHWAWEGGVKSKKAKGKSDQNPGSSLSTFNFQLSTLSPIFLSVSAFASIFVLAGFLGVNPNFSFWSNFERGEGGFQMLHYFAFFALLVLVMKSESDWRNMFIASIIAAGLMVGYGILAISGFDGFIAPTYGWKDRFYGSLGNPDYVTTYLTFALFFIAYLWFTAKNKKYWNWIAPALLIFFSIFFLLSGTRGGFLGLAAGILFGFVYLIFAIKDKRWKILLIGFLLALIFLVSSLIAFRETSFVQSIPGSRIFNISLDAYKNDFGVQSRFWAWAISVESIKERPLLGWGPENFSIAFDRYFNAHFFTPKFQTETWFDRAHSIFFDHLAEAGILGLISYIAIFTSFYWQFFKLRIKVIRQQVVTDYQLLITDSLIFALPIAYLVSGIFLFEVLPMYMNIFLFLAFANYKLSNN